MLNENATLLGETPPHPAYLEAYRRLRTSVIAQRDEHAFRSVLITSAQPHEGRTTVTLDLATVLAMGDLSVTVVDGDFSHPEIHSRWRLPASPGITDGCLQNLPIEAIVHSMDVAGLRVVTAGSAASAGGDIAAGTALGGLLRELSAQSDLLLIDSPPVLGASVALQLARMVDAVLLVARSGGNVAPVRQALRLLKDVGRDPLGIILNDILPQDEERRSLPHF